MLWIFVACLPWPASVLPDKKASSDKHAEPSLVFPFLAQTDTPSTFYLTELHTFHLLQIVSHRFPLTRMRQGEEYARRGARALDCRKKLQLLSVQSVAKLRHGAQVTKVCMHACMHTHMHLGDAQ